MGANSVLRKAAKRIFHPLLNERSYRYLQGLAMARDIRRGSWSEPELDLIPCAVSEGDAVLDIGANYGLYVYHLSRAVGAAGKVFAFEPVPFTHATLQLVSKLLRLKNVELFAKGCSDGDGRIPFQVPVQSSGAVAAGLAHMGSRNDDHPGKEEQVRWESTREVVCDVVALDAFLPEVASLALIKCDIEGAELFAFRGAQRIIDRHHPSVICEINPWYLDGFGVRVEDLIAFFVDRDYRLYRYQKDAGNRRLVHLPPSEVVEDNYVFIHPRRQAGFEPLLA